MKKLLGLTALAGLLVLAACGGNGGSDETVCTGEIDGMNMIATAQSEDGDITLVEAEMRVPLGIFGLEAADIDLDSDEIDAVLNAMGFDGDADVDVDGDDLIVTVSGTPEALDFASTVDEFIAAAEADGATCN